MKHVLLFKIGAIGDVLMTTPFVRQFKKQSPHYIVEYMIGKKTSPILQGNPHIHKILPFDESCFLSKNILGLWRFFLKIRKMRSHYDAVVIFDKHRIFGLLFRLAGFKKRVGFDRAGKEGRFLTDKLFRDASQRETEYNLKLLTFFSLKPDYTDQSYDVDIDAHDQAIDHMMNSLKSSGKKILGISTGGGNAITHSVHGKDDCRRRSLQNRTALTQKLLEQGYIVLLLGSDADRRLPIKHPDFHDLLGRYPLKGSIYLISKLDTIICQESGFMHLVGCTQTPMIVLAGPTDPHRLCPYHHPGTILRKEKKECYDLYGSYKACTGQEMNKIAVDDVLHCL